jgi:energy-coupling factor transporter ATP-binding protein EcfA2
MCKNNTTNETLEQLKAILDNHKNERVCVIGTICCGKTTLLRQIPNCVDLDAELWPRLTKEETAFLSQTPWTKEMGDEIDRLIYENVTVKPGFPLFGSVILDCEAVVYLDIDDDLLMEHCKKRGVSFTDAKNVKKAIEGDWNNHKAKNEKVFYYLKVTE